MTEGVRKADAGASQGLTILAINGIWGWRGTNARGGKAALADWEAVPVDGRTVILVPDSDVWRPARMDLRKSIERLTGMLISKGATVKWCQLPEVEDGDA